MTDLERRTFATELRIDRREDKPARIEGHAAVFDSLSENLGGFREQIAPGAFDSVLEDDVVALFNHNADQVLARTTAEGAQKLDIGVDERGLTYSFSPDPHVSYANDLLRNMENGLVTQSSFGFTIDQDTWTEDEAGGVIRTIHSVRQLFDVSPVVWPAYTDTDSAVAQRRLEQFERTRVPEPPPNWSRYKRATELLTMRSRGVSRR